MEKTNGYLAFRWKADIKIDSAVAGKLVIGASFSLIDSKPRIIKGDDEKATNAVNDTHKDVVARWGDNPMKPIVESLQHYFDGSSFVFPGEGDLKIENAFFNGEGDLLCTAKLEGGLDKAKDSKGSTQARL